MTVTYLEPGILQLLIFYIVQLDNPIEKVTISRTYQPKLIRSG